ncbi:hypothetical protein BASA62_006568 [Batrachochytrium salamandrivorans]|nr:hypothetical protein BASA62_006568 [Batrachochytrium salamandrivorans]
MRTYNYADWLFSPPKNRATPQAAYPSADRGSPRAVLPTALFLGQVHALATSLAYAGCSMHSQILRLESLQRLESQATFDAATLTMTKFKLVFSRHPSTELLSTDVLPQDTSRQQQHPALPTTTAMSLSIPSPLSESIISELPATSSQSVVLPALTTLNPNNVNTTAAARTTQCPICGNHIRAEDLESHYNAELSIVDCNPYVIPSLAASQNERSRRGAAVAAVAAMNKIQEKSKGPALIDENEKTLQRVRVERIKRSTGRGGNQLGNNGGKKRQRGGAQAQHSSEGAYIDHPDESICFICGLFLPRGAAAINDHLDRCLEKGAKSSPTSAGGSGAEIETGSGTVPLEASSSKPWLEYTWGGEVRVRATALLEGNFEASGFTVNKKTYVDTEEDIDIDEDGTDEFGIPQFHEDDIKPYMDVEIDIENESDAHEQTVVESSLVFSRAEETVNDATSESSHDKLVIESLKAHIRAIQGLGSKMSYLPRSISRTTCIHHMLACPLPELLASHIGI